MNIKSNTTHNHNPANEVLLPLCCVVRVCCYVCLAFICKICCNVSLILMDKLPLSSLHAFTRKLLNLFVSLLFFFKHFVYVNYLAFEIVSILIYKFT